MIYKYGNETVIGREGFKGDRPVLTVRFGAEKGFLEGYSEIMAVSKTVDRTNRFHELGQ